MSEVQPQEKFQIGDWEISLVPQSKPRELVIELTTECNLNCLHCFRSSMKEPFGSMSNGTMTRVLEEVSNNNIKAVTLSGLGEPLYHPKALWFIKELKERGARVLLNTNGIFLSKHLNEIIDLGVDALILSIEGLEPETYKLFRIGADLDIAIQCIRGTYSKKRELKSNLPLVGVQFTLTRVNANQIGKLSELIRNGVGVIIISNIIPISHYYEELACFNDEDCAKLYSEQLEILGRKLVDVWNVFVSRSYTTPQQTFHCPFVENDALFIRWDGKVAPCLHYSHDWVFYMNGTRRSIKSVIFGDVKEESIVDIWRKINYVMFRFKAKFGYKPSCFDCHLRNWCSYTFSNEADCYGNTPTCAHCPLARGLSSCPLVSLVPISKIALQPTKS
ncbi:MAG: radical SAM protein [Crenarchaeota archaeon]|nr:radical SAM protein [Thermoproteota archaeon]